MSGSPATTSPAVASRDLALRSGASQRLQLLARDGAVVERQPSRRPRSGPARDPCPRSARRRRRARSRARRGSRPGGRAVRRDDGREPRRRHRPRSPRRLRLRGLSDVSTARSAGPGRGTHLRPLLAVAVAAAPEHDDHPAFGCRDRARRGERLLERFGSVRVVDEHLEPTIVVDSLHPAGNDQRTRRARRRSCRASCPADESPSRPQPTRSRR